MRFTTCISQLVSSLVSVSPGLENSPDSLVERQARGRRDSNPSVFLSFPFFFKINRVLKQCFETGLYELQQILESVLNAQNFISDFNT